MELKLGKAPARMDRRTIKLSSILKPLPPPPESYSVDMHLTEQPPVSMLGNDDWGDCVIVARANQQLRFECVEQNKCIPITAGDCLTEYWREQGYDSNECFLKKILDTINGYTYPDNGLIALNSLNEWRNTGWTIGGRTYTIYAYAMALSELDIKHCIQYLYGAQVGIALPKSAVTQFKEGQPWTVTADESLEGGHMIYAGQYDADWLECITWGRKQLMSWDFFNKYRDESYGVVTNRNVDDPSNPVDVDKLNEILAQITS